MRKCCISPFLFYDQYEYWTSTVDKWIISSSRSIVPGKALAMFLPASMRLCPFWHSLKSQQLNQEPSVSWWGFRTETWQLRYLLPFNTGFLWGQTTIVFLVCHCPPTLLRIFKGLPTYVFFLPQTSLFTCCASNIFLCVAAYVGSVLSCHQLVKNLAGLPQEPGGKILPPQCSLHQLNCWSIAFPVPKALQGWPNSPKCPEQLIQPGSPRYWHNKAKITEGEDTATVQAAI